MRLTAADHSFGCPEAGWGRPGFLAGRVKWRKAALLAVFVGCGEPTKPPDGVFIFDFDRGSQGFTAGFADYPKGQEDFFELTSGHRAIPSPLGSRSGLFISGHNRSDDLFMFFKGRIDGLMPGARYDIEVSVEIATDTPAGCLGIGGPPGEGVSIKAGATAVEPVALGAYMRMNIDVGNQANSGTQAVVLGNIANSRSCEQSPRWELKSFESRSVPASILAPADGRAWLLIGSDSGFEGRTGIYFTRATVELEPRGQE